MYLVNCHRKSLLCFLVLLTLTGCDQSQREISTEYCSNASGCINGKLIAEAERVCGEQLASEKGCQISLKSLIGDVDNIYFMEHVGTELEKCSTIPAPDALKYSYDPLCGYIILAKEKKASTYLHARCDSGSRVYIPTGETTIGFGLDSDKNMSWMSVLNASVPVQIVREDLGGHNIVYWLTLPESELKVLSDDKCIGF